MSAGAVAGEDHIAAVVAAERSPCSRCRATRPAASADRPASVPQWPRSCLRRLLRARDLADGVAEVARIAEVDRGDRRDGLGHDLFGIDLDAQRQAHENGELGAGVKAAHILGGIGLGVAFGLGIGQDGAYSAPSSILLRMKLQVPLRMPSMRSMRSPASPCSRPGITGIPPATAAPYFRCVRPGAAASRSNSTPWKAISFLLAVTTLLPASRARRTQAPAGSRPPASSTMTSTSESSTAFGSRRSRRRRERSKSTRLRVDAAVEDVGQLQGRRAWTRRECAPRSCPRCQIRRWRCAEDGGRCGSGRTPADEVCGGRETLTSDKFSPSK